MLDILLGTRGVGSMYLDPIDQKYKSLWVSEVRLGMNLHAGSFGISSNNDIDSSDENYVSSTGTSGHGGSSRPSSEWALRDNKDIKAEELRLQEIGDRVQEHWIYKKDKHFDYFFYIDY